MALSETLFQVWDEWEIRALLLLSLSLQAILTTLGSVRKHSKSTLIRLFVWSAYMSADTVASVALGILARSIDGAEPGNNNKNKNSSNSIQLLWTPFLILHLGGPDTITAYSLEDNELWPRHFLGIVVQIGLAMYVAFKSWRHSQLKWIAVPVILIGTVKYVEKGFVLIISGTKAFRNILLSDPEPGRDYPEDVRKKKSDPNFVPSPMRPCVSSQGYSGYPDDSLSQAFYLYNRLSYLYLDLILSYSERQDCHSMICSKSSEEAFELVEGELGFLYDELYTKVAALHLRYRGYLRRCFTLFLCFFSLVSFMIFIDHTSPPADISITYLLLIGAITLEVYGFVFLILSDWTKVWLLGYFKLKKVRSGKRWSRKISKYNLIKFCLRQQDDSMWIKFLGKLRIKEMVTKHLNVEHEDVDAELKSFIFQQLKERSENVNSLLDINLCKKLLSYRGDNVLEKLECLDLLKWSTIDVEFDHSLLLWHIATQICYYEDVKRLKGSNSLENLNKCSKLSKGLSDYMMYLLVMYPNMLPKGIGEIRYIDTCAEATRFFQKMRKTIGTKIDEACHELYEVDTDLLEELKGDTSKSVLFYGSRLAKQLQTLGSREDWGFEKKWDMINEVWVEMLAYAAVHCGWKEHGQQLRRGGELLTHVCVLMAHLGLSEQYQIQKENSETHEDKLIECPPACDPFLKLLRALGFTPRRTIN
ncbi:uncharacterized protein LOC105780937 [Gossypium raimondii]|uniref:DUF4220 domain-containing protein n=1 Tax=Gossypium raimondii TaxID=29730 RepID=A0A0D2VVP4_GOSRA|nr:uncharacterized protein LOC105780937 [Gossypium raimondii]KJB75660.1 hypothetical protein B456_012G050500 [Gossypium raimondii]MBA0600965.1 hypothetical protein [Gossypium raimondii]